MSHDLTYGPVMVLVMMMNPESLDNLAYKACKLFHNLFNDTSHPNHKIPQNRTNDEILNCGK